MTDQLICLNPDPNGFTAYGYCANATIDAGAFVKAVSSNDVVDTSTSYYSASDIKVEEADDASGDYALVVGLAGNDVSTTGDWVQVYTRGVFIVRAGDAITAGSSVQVAEATDEYEIIALDSTYGEHKIGRALTAASAADAYVVLLLRI